MTIKWNDVLLFVIHDILFINTVSLLIQFNKF